MFYNYTGTGFQFEMRNFLLVDKPVRLIIQALDDCLERVDVAVATCSEVPDYLVSKARPELDHRLG